MRRVALLALALLAACGGESPRYLVGEPYRLGGRWYYPQEDFAYTATGLAAVLPDRASGRRTANGEVHDPNALMAAHRTLQLPTVVRVTNLETGRSLLVRVNDRGPADPGREIALSRRAAELLGIPPGGAAPVRVAVEQDASRALAQALAGTAARPSEPAPILPIATAPRPRLEGEALPPPPGARAATPAVTAARPAAGPEPLVPPAAVAPPPPPDRLPERVEQGPPQPGRLWLDAGRFFTEAPARQQAARIGARAEPVGSGRARHWRVRQGPFPSIAAADAALAAAFAAGIADARLVIE
jgi:rare lipoprotein A